MKKILIVNNNMHVGGIQNALMNLLQEINNDYKIDLCILGQKGELMDSIPENINVLSGNKYTKILGLSQAEAKEDGFGTWVRRSVFSAIAKIFGVKFPYNYLTKKHKLTEHYDAAISFMQNADFNLLYGGCNEFVLNSVTNADIKISFVHDAFTDYSGKNHYHAVTYSKFDRIAGVSASQAERFRRKCPEVAPEKVYAVHNCHDIKTILERSNEFDVDFNDETINVFSAVRICEEKGVVRMIPIFAKLKEEGFKFNWKVAGMGPLEDQVKQLIKELNMENEIQMLGLKPNPYPYFKNCDLVLLPSFFEAAPMVYGEAELLGTPVLTTDTTSAKELVEDRNIGWVCGKDDKSVEDKLREIFKNGKPERLKNSNITNELALKEFDIIVSK